MTSNPLIGTWRLISWENRSAAGQVSYPLGRAAVGYIMYNEDGYMFVAIMSPYRLKFAGDLFGGSTEEKAQAASSYVSYCGRYEFRGETVIHHVELSLFHNWVGVDQERLVDLTGDRLTLSTRPILPWRQATDCPPCACGKRKPGEPFRHVTGCSYVLPWSGASGCFILTSKGVSSRRCGRVGRILSVGS
jgi:Lipocalin-like domain